MKAYILVHRSRWMTRDHFLIAAGALALGVVSASPSQRLTAAQVRAMLESPPRGGVPNLAGRDLSYLDLKGLHFRHADLHGANLFSANLNGADLSAARLSGANLANATLDGANLRSADLRGATILGLMRGADLTHANLSGASGYPVAPNAILVGADLSRVHFGTQMENQPMGQLRATFANADLHGANLSWGDFSFADFSFAKLTRARLVHTIFASADLRNADLTAADIGFADFSRAETDGIVLAGAHGMTTARGLKR